MVLIFDSEATGLDVENDRVHCVVARDYESGEEWAFGPDDLHRVKDLFSSAQKLIAHNGISYDYQILKSNGIVTIPPDKLVDSLVLSRLYYPDRQGGHGVGAWAKTLGMVKPDVEDFSEYSEDMLFRCKEDVAIQSRIYQELLRERGDHDWTLAEKIEHQIQWILYEQERYGWKFRKNKAESLVQWLEEEMDRAEKAVQPHLSLYMEYKGDVNKPFKLDGSLTKITEDWCATDSDDSIRDCISGPFGRVSYVPVRLSQRDKLAEKLMEIGWKPTSYTEKGSPQLTPNKEPCPNLAYLGDVGENIKHYFLCNHRRGQIQGWIDHCREDGRVPSVAIGNGTNTGRMAHKIIANVPKASESVFLGAEMRDLFTHEEGNTLVGWDAEGLELRVLAHYMNDSDFTEAVANGDKSTQTDIHNVMWKASEGIIPDRDTTKNCVYAIIYGAGDYKLGATAGHSRNSKKVGKSLRDKWANRFPALLRLEQRVVKTSERGFLKAIDGRRVWLRRDQSGKILTHKGLNTLIQSTGSVIIKTASCILWNWVEKEGLSACSVTHYHDELVAEVALKDVDRYKELCYKAMKKTEEFYNFRCPLSIEVKTGQSWKEVH